MFKLFRNTTLQVEVTTACNLNCTICLRRGLERPNKFLSLDDFKRVLDSGSFRYVGLHGWGEPLLHQELFEMVEYAESRGVHTNLTTNGTLVGERLDEIFRSRLREIAFGIYDKELLSEVSPQVEGLVVNRKKGRFKRPKIYFDITIYQGNRDQIPEMMRFAAEMKIDAIILHRLFNVYGVDSEAKCLSEEEERELFKEIKGIARSLKIELYLPERHSYPCRIVRRSIFVTADGKVTPCTYLLEDHLGDAFEEGVERILRSEVYGSFVKHIKQHPICSKCRW